MLPTHLHRGQAAGCVPEAQGAILTGSDKGRRVGRVGMQAEYRRRVARDQRPLTARADVHPPTSTHTIALRAGTCALRQQHLQGTVRC